MKWKGLAAVALTAAMALVSGCAPSGSSTPTDTPAAGGDVVTLKVWSWRVEDKPIYEKIFKVFEEKNPGIKVSFEAFQNTEYNQILATGLAGSDGPDVPMVRSYGLLQPLVEAGQLDPLDDLVTGLDGVNESVMAGARGRADGKLYSVPLATQTLQMFYNKDIFDQHGLTAPTTWDEFIKVNDTLLEAGVTPMALGAKDSWVLPIFTDVVGSARYGGSDFEKKVLSGETDFNDPNYVAALQIVKDMQKYLTKDVVGVGYADSQVQFTSGQAAQFPGGSFEIKGFQKAAPDMKIGSYQVPLPPDAVLKAPVTPLYADGNFGLNAKSAHKDEAVKLLNWLATPEFGTMVAEELNMFSAIPGVEYTNPVMQEAWANAQKNSSPYLLLVDFRYGEPQGTAVLGEQVQKMFLDQSTPDTAAAALQDGVSQWFKPTK